jgi:hypothetical protein
VGAQGGQARQLVQVHDDHNDEIVRTATGRADRDPGPAATPVDRTIDCSGRPSFLAQNGWDSMARVLRRVGPTLMLTALVVVSVLRVTTLQQPDAANPACPDQQSSWAAGCKG